MQDHRLEGYALARVRDTARSVAHSGVADIWVDVAEVNRLRREANRRTPFREWTVTHFGWETLGEAFHSRPLAGGT